ncbi:MAG: M14 family zinc carboxypeptidase [Pseudomonadota bacterium]
MKFIALTVILSLFFLGCSLLPVDEKISPTHNGPKVVTAQDLPPDVNSPHKMENSQSFVEERDSTMEHNAEKQAVLQSFCKKINGAFGKYKWDHDIVCNPGRWTYDHLTSGGNPLLYATFFNPQGKNTTLFMCAVHGDEVTSAYMCIRLVRDILFDNPQEYRETNIVVAPFLNPDGLLKDRPSRVNLNGVDVNRNFPTSDWDKLAIKSWKKDFKGHAKWNPGTKGGSEIETQFQIELIERFRPDKIISVHSPYGFFDFDIALNSKNNNFIQLREETKTLAKEMGQRSSFRVNKFGYFPGSLGNYAGNERSIPTFTLELPGSESHKALAYWKRFKKSLVYLAQYDFKTRLAKTPELKKVKEEKKF